MFVCEYEFENIASKYVPLKDHNRKRQTTAQVQTKLDVIDKLTSVVQKVVLLYVG